MKSINRLSRVFQPVNVVPHKSEIKKEVTMSISQKLMTDTGIIKPAMLGFYHFLPLGVRALDKLTKIVQEEMEKIGAQKVAMPILASADLWLRTGRITKGVQNPELFTLQDRHSRSYILSPTCEETVTDLIASQSPISHRQLPLRLFQISNKFRDEMHPRHGLLRSRQFIMKDLYSFDESIQAASTTYEEVSKAYLDVFKKLEINIVKVQAPPGEIGGSLSHEYHILTPVGEDKIMECLNCKKSFIEDKNNCCDNPNLQEQTGIEVGHTFLLGIRYSEKLGATYLGKNGKPVTLQMCCFGLGITRILSAALETLSENNQLRWPFRIAPYSVIIIPPKSGSKEESATENLIPQIYDKLNKIFQNDIIVDDRNRLTIGKRMLEAKRFGYPFIIVIGNDATKETPTFELHNLIEKTEHNFDINEIVNYLNLFKKKNKLTSV